MNHITADLVEKLIQEQFPKWAHLEVKPVKLSGHDNRTFHLGDQMSVRLPSDAAYAPQVEKENKWLPILSKELSLPISAPIAKGNPSEEYLWPWSINKWIEGETVTKENVRDLNEFAADLGSFLIELQSIDASNGPVAGAHNFYRGGLISVYDEEARVAIENNKDVFDETLLKHLWDLALRSTWNRKPVWVHGDVAPGNLLVKDGKLCAVIDFGILGVGDPACDAAMAWHFLIRIVERYLKKYYVWMKKRGIEREDGRFGRR